MTICVIGSQDPPIASDHSLVVAEESVATPLAIAAPIDVDGDVLTITVTGLPSLGTVFLADGVTPVTNNQTLTVAELTSLVYDAPSTFTVPTAGDFTYDVFDGTDTDSGVVDITITPVNDAPTIDLNGAGAGEDFKSTFTEGAGAVSITCLLYTSPSPRDQRGSRMPSSA